MACWLLASRSKKFDDEWERTEIGRWKIPREKREKNCTPTIWTDCCCLGSLVGRNDTNRVRKKIRRQLRHCVRTRRETWQQNLLLSSVYCARLFSLREQSSSNSRIFSSHFCIWRDFLFNTASTNTEARSVVKSCVPQTSEEEMTWNEESLLFLHSFTDRERFLHCFGCGNLRSKCWGFEPSGCNCRKILSFLPGHVAHGREKNPDLRQIRWNPHGPMSLLRRKCTMHRVRELLRSWVLHMKRRKKFFLSSR